MAGRLLPGTSDSPRSGSGSAAWDDAGGSDREVDPRWAARRPADLAQPIGAQNEVEIEMEIDVREFLIGGL